MAALARSSEYVAPDADVHYYTAVAFSAKRDYASAVTAADEALAIHRGSRTDKAKIFFIKGEALMNSGDSAGAREAFTQAAVGQYRASAQHYLEQLGTN